MRRNLFIAFVILIALGIFYGVRAIDNKLASAPEVTHHGCVYNTPIYKASEVNTSCGTFLIELTQFNQMQQGHKYTLVTQNSAITQITEEH